MTSATPSAAGGAAAEQVAALEATERAELARLRAEVDELRATAQRPVADTGAAGRSPRWVRAAAAAALIGLACLLAPLSVVATWARSQITDTERYVATVAPLAEDPAVQEAAARLITEEIFARVDVDALSEDALTALGGVLPPAVASRLDLLSGTLAAGIRNVVDEQVGNLVASDVFANAWAEANRAAHDQLLATLTGSSGALTIDDTTVSVNLATFAEAVKQRLSDRGFGLADRIPEIDAQFVILQSEDLPALQRGFDLLERLGFWLPIVATSLLLLGIYVAHDHRRAIIGAGVGVAVTLLLAAAALALARGVYLDAVRPDVLGVDAAAAVFDSIVRFLREGLRALGLLAVVVAAGAFLTGPSVTARRVRQLAHAAAAATARGLSRLGVPVARTATVVTPLRRGLTVGLVLLALVAFVVPAYPTVALVVQVTLLLLVALFVLDVLTAAPRGQGEASEPAPLDEATQPL